MYIKKFQVEGFRGFKDQLTLELDPKVNVLVGVNGAGKSSLLDGMEYMLFWFVKDFAVLKEIDLKDKDICDISKKLEMQIWLIKDVELVSWKAHKDRKYNAFTYPEGGSSQIIHGSWITDFFNSKEKLNLPIIQFYQSSRLLADKITESSRFYSPYEDFTSHALFSDFTSWFINIKNYENHIRLNKDNNYRNNELLALEKALVAFFNLIEQGTSKFSKIDLYYEEISDFANLENKPELVLLKNETILKIEKLSDGEKMLLLMIGNIVRGLSGMSTFTFGIEKALNRLPEDILSGPGIVLIDEIELHLHPAWQRNIIPALTATFPNIQFIVTTQSPQVLSNVDSKSVFILEDFKLVENTPPTKGRDSNSILWEVFAVEERPKIVKDLLQSFYSQLEDDLQNAEKTMELLSQMLGDQDKEVLRARYHLDIEIRLSKEAS
jgi:predicted ATP-binding protein involved in virulence